MPKVCLLAILRPWRVTADQKPARGVCACEGRLLLTSSRPEAAACRMAKSRGRYWAFGRAWFVADGLRFILKMAPAALKSTKFSKGSRLLALAVISSWGGGAREKVAENREKMFPLNKSYCSAKITKTLIFRPTWQGLRGPKKYAWSCHGRAAEKVCVR